MRKRSTRRPRGVAPRLGAALIAACALAAPGLGRAGEVCRFEGRTNHAGQVAVTTSVSAGPDGLTVVDVALDLRASVWWVLGVEYLAEEISTWRGGELVGVAVNNRTLADGRAVRQQWDVFRPGAGGLEGWRVQAKTPAEFRRDHPAFARHWDPGTFGLPWLGDYAAAGPKRRPDLDLARGALPAGAWTDLRTPLALAFYWTRRLGAGGRDALVFLPGFKRDARAEIAVAPAGAQAGAWQSWRAALQHPALSAGEPSEAKVWVSPDRHLLQLAFDVHTRRGDGHGAVHALGCRGDPSEPS